MNFRNNIYLQKNLRKRLIFLVAFLFLLIVFMNSVSPVGIVDVKNEKGRVTFFTCKILGFYIQGLLKCEDVFSIKLINFSVDKLTTPLLIKYRGKNLISFIGEDSVKVFSKEGNEIWQYNLSNYDYILSSCAGDVDKDLTDEIFLITGKRNENYGENFIILTLEDGIKLKLFEEMKVFNPWKVQIADVDADENLEISIGVYKKAELHPVMAKRPFIYGLNEGGLFPKWRGSRLSRPFDDYVFFDIDDDGKDELLSVETLKDGKKILSAYKWKGFGFELFSESRVYDKIDSIVKEEKRVLLSVKDGKASGWGIMEYEGGKLSIRITGKRYYFRLKLEGV
ncbi:hypothetical protein [Thermovenabulum gondwanense]|uniref:VCBS repeat-containing protein n=1 Tax=Thermovenabulum gondwanense TaxID=520767 RepID=A0A161PWH3_9FIRM|nr:hypothetical protein [Thermovenabulum gondwanense]KYO65530.1 hypothetical protein ATZ99_15660 [Thermovenabulum gondwanense]